jgi:hypothetical protein
MIGIRPSPNVAAGSFCCCTSPPAAIAAARVDGHPHDRAWLTNAHDWWHDSETDHATLSKSGPLLNPDEVCIG